MNCETLEAEWSEKLGAPVYINGYINGAYERYFVYIAGIYQGLFTSLEDVDRELGALV
jgi:hypothetical protein